MMSFVSGLYISLTNQISCRCTPSSLKSLLAAVLPGEGLAQGSTGPARKPWKQLLTVRRCSTDFAF